MAQGWYLCGEHSRWRQKPFRVTEVVWLWSLEIVPSTGIVLCAESPHRVELHEVCARSMPALCTWYVIEYHMCQNRCNFYTTIFTGNKWLRQLQLSWLLSKQPVTSDAGVWIEKVGLELVDVTIGVITKVTVIIMLPPPGVNYTQRLHDIVFNVRILNRQARPHSEWYGVIRDNSKGYRRQLGACREMIATKLTACETSESREIG